MDTTTGLISGTPTATGVFPVTISATNDPNDPCEWHGDRHANVDSQFSGRSFHPAFSGPGQCFQLGPKSATCQRYDPVSKRIDE